MLFLVSAGYLLLGAAVFRALESDSAEGTKPKTGNVIADVV